MAAGQGFKTFATGDVLTAADTNGYLMQGVWVFANAAARTAAVTSPQEGNMSFLKDTNSTEYYDGAAWVAIGGSGSTAVNLLLNSNFALNQRAYASGANLASGAYGFDRWKSNYTNTTLTFTASTQGQSLTINASGGLQQVIERGLVPAGTYTLSWTGTATARVYNSGGTPGSYAVSPVTFTADGLANVVVEFTAVSTTKTLSKVQFNAGTGTSWSLATPTLETELAACQRYYVRFNSEQAYGVFGYGFASGSAMTGAIIMPVQLRALPSSVDYANIAAQTGSALATVYGSSAVAIEAATSTLNLQMLSVTAAGTTANDPARILANNSTSAYLAFSAEL